MMMFPTTGETVSGQQIRRDDQMLYFMIKPDPKSAAAMDGLRCQHDLERK